MNASAALTRPISGYPQHSVNVIAMSSGPCSLCSWYLHQLTAGDDRSTIDRRARIATAWSSFDQPFSAFLFRADDPEGINRLPRVRKATEAIFSRARRSIFGAAFRNHDP